MKRNILIAVLGLFLTTACQDKHHHEHATHAHENESSCEGHDHQAEGHNHQAETTSKSAHADEIVFHEDKAKAAGVKVTTLTPQSFNQVITTSGHIQAAQGDETTVVATVAGIVSFQTPVTEGMTVRQGMPLVTLSSKEMLDGNPVQRAKVDYEVAKKEFERAQKLYESRIISEKEYNNIRQVYEKARISYEAVASNQTAKGQLMKAPMSGYVKTCLVNEGDYVSVGQPLVSITQNRRLFLRAEVSERYYKYLKSITTANFQTPYDNQVYKLKELNGKILSFGKAAGSNSYYIPITFEFDNKGDILPGSFVTVHLLSAPMNNVLALPKTALTEEQGLYFVYLQLDAECYKKQEVTLGADNGLEVQILSGLHPGDKVVTEGAYQVKLAGATSAIPAHSHEH